jgi:hypothetical protein
VGVNYFDNHEWYTLLGLAFFPRITLIVGSFVTGGVLWWVGWLFGPHILVAILSLHYWDSNPVLVVCAWLCALGGTGGEGSYAQHRYGRSY